MPEHDDWFPTSRYGSPTLNVRSFGATGDGSTNDGPALQAALDAIRVTGSARALYIPAGQYNTTQVLHLINTHGARIFGDGMGSTTIKYVGGVDIGNTIGSTTPVGGITPSTFTPVIITDGWSTSSMKGLALHNAVGSTTHVGMYIYQSSPVATYGVTTGNTYEGVTVYGLDGGGVAKAATGFLIGYDHLCSEQLFLGCQANQFASYGWSVAAQNALNINLVGCGGTDNAVWARCSNGQMNISGASLAMNGVDIKVGNTPMSISGCRSESKQFVDATGSGTWVSMSGCIQLNEEAGFFISLQNGSAAVIQSCVGSTTTPDACRVLGGSNCPVWLRGNYWGTGVAFLKDFVGVIREFEHNDIARTVAALPTAAAKWAGVRLFVTDANATTFGTTVAAGGSNKVPVWCDGAAWKIG